MKIIEPSAELFDFVDTEAVMKKLEACGRVSHQSEPRENSAEKFVRMLIKRGHESVLEHVSLTFHIICDRAIQNELVRHRHASFTVESTRYVDYDELEVIQPPDIITGKIGGMEWVNFVERAESAYDTLRVMSVRPEQARAVLPNCLKSELYMTANLREWRHILKLRTDKAAHPQMRQVMNQVLAVFKEKLPVIVEDIP
ncbi:MAG: FAD-dependent thymidylate synthase [Selenomonadaceae bacterium]|nr:FAD-dependent thymidylate synthase [Selenomonadaceae bacterium]